MEQYHPSSQANCATCENWRGPRCLSPAGQEACVYSADVPGVCSCCPEKKPASSSCQRWRTWTRLTAHA